MKDDVYQLLMDDRPRPDKQLINGSFPKVSVPVEIWCSDTSYGSGARQSTRVRLCTLITARFRERFAYKF
jgi:hypothetical protein